MDTLKNKRYLRYDYRCRYASVPVYFDTLGLRDVPGLGKNMLLNSPVVTHKLTSGDTLDSLALDYYNNPSYWWVIAYFNDIQDAFKPLMDQFEVLQIPSISSIAFGDRR